MDLFERGCPKTLTRGPVPRHHSLANSMCCSSFFTALRICIVWSRVLGPQPCSGINTGCSSEQLLWQRNFSTWGDRLTSKLCLSKIHWCYWLRLLGSKKSNPTSVQFFWHSHCLPLFLQNLPYLQTALSLLNTLLMPGKHKRGIPRWKAPLSSMLSLSHPQTPLILGLPRQIYRLKPKLHHS